MLVNPRITLALQALIIALLALLVIAQAFMIPAVAAGTAARNPEFAHLEVPGVLGGVVFLGLVELVLLCIWRLLSLVRAEKIFSEKAFIWINVIIGALLAAAVLILASYVVLFIAQAANPGILILALLGVTVGIALALLMIVMRGLLRKALQLEQDLSEVV
jgi:hypothetical protein